MIQFALLDWAAVAVSLANTVLLLWLGFTILLNAENRYWGVWLSGGGLLVSGAFFISHTAILGHGLTSLDNGLTFWWYLGLVAALISPIIWYIVILWYAGYWDDRNSQLRRRQRPWFALNLTLAILLGVLLIFANPFPSYVQVATLNLSPTPDIAGVPVLIVVYAASTMLSVGLSLDALWRPGPSRRMMADVARQRARPWLVATAIDLVLVGLMVAAVMLWVILHASDLARMGLYGEIATEISLFDLLISCLILAAVIFIGQAVVGYEVFTGKTLPQRRFMRHWRNAVTLAIGYGAVMSAVLQIHLHPVHILLLMAIMMTVFYSLFSQMSYQERERYIQDLRPFVLSQRLYEQLVTGSVPAELDISRPFEALCGEVLGAQTAYLAALGPLAPLVGPVGYPRPVSNPTWSLIDLAGKFDSPQTICIALDQNHYGGAMWAVPLWSERGLIGVLLLGEKRNGSLYTREEIEIARASGERLIDTQASAEMARRLMALQRQRLAESQIVDRQTRRRLHDDVLPQLHAAMLTLSTVQDDPAATASNVVNLLADIHHQIADLLHEMPSQAAPAVAQAGLIAALRKVIDEELSSAFDSVTWQVDGQVEQEVLRIPLLTSEVLYYAARESIRNAARYGRGRQAGRALHLCIQITRREELELVIEDDGVGLENAEPSQGGSGHGLALHSTMMAVVGGSLAIESVPGQFTRVLMVLPHVASTEVFDPA